ncbi:tetratricopeptide repeat protein [Candidatus Amarobacter glycogenicus]|uniref:tetratricopeptide repeat protein n=1 Tax=Candidatus Amarobacter glycogenicus TaxID=3140699 RepID=UPI002A11AC7C|nr:tetratricopeptide repeat protein [Dehalococcoidia bacterium]
MASSADSTDLLRRAQAALDGGTYANSAAIFAEAANAAELSNDLFALVTASRGLGESLRLFTRFADAMPHYERGLELAKEQKDTNSERVCEFGLGTCLRMLNRYEESVPHYERALALAKERKEANREMEAEWGLGESLRLFTRYAEAMPHYERGLELRRGGRPLTNACESGLGPSVSDSVRRVAPHAERALAWRKSAREANREMEAEWALGAVCAC